MPATTVSPVMFTEYRGQLHRTNGVDVRQHAGEESQNFHEAFTFEAAGAYDVMLEVCATTNVWTSFASVWWLKGNATESHEETLDDVVSGVEEEIVFNTNNPVMTSEGWMIDLGTEGEGMTMMAYDLTGRQLCSKCSQRRRPDLHREQPMAQRGVAAFGSTNQRTPCALGKMVR